MRRAASLCTCVTYNAASASFRQPPGGGAWNACTQPFGRGMNTPAFLLCVGCAFALAHGIAHAGESRAAPGSNAAQAQSATADTADVQRLIAAAAAGDRAQVERIAGEIKAHPRAARGDRRKARDLNDRGLALWQRQRYSEAADYFSQARAADGGSAEIAENLGYALLKSGRITEAERALVDALAMAPERASAWGSLGQIYAKQGRHRDGVGCLLTAYRYASNPKRALDVYSRLAATDEDPRVRALLSDVVTRLSGT
jgi:tetratricopeptide (TPR) repeat protein